MGVLVKEKIKGSGEWWLFINHKGIRKSKRVGRDQKKAIEVAKQVEAQLVLGDVGIIEQKLIPTFAEYAKTWFDVVVPATCKYSTSVSYKGLLNNYALPVFGKKPVTEISRMDVKSFLMKKVNSGLASRTVTHLKNVIGGILNLALDDEAITVNPAHRLGKYMREKSLRLESDPLTRDELSSFLAVVSEHYPKHYAMVLTLARTGMRIGEVIALKWGDVDFNSRFIVVQRNRYLGREGTPKNGKSRRVDMSRQLADTLLELRHHRKEEAMAKGEKEIPEYLFVTETGRPIIVQHWYDKVFKKALVKVGLRQIRIHDLRHTYASLLIQAGESLAYIRDQLGHHSIKVTVDIYGHLAPEGNKEAVDRLDDDAPIRTPGAPKKGKESTQKANSLIKLVVPTGVEPVFSA